MIPADLLARLQEADPGLWEKIAETALSEYEYHDEDFNAWIFNAITYTNLFGPAQDAWLQHCLQDAIRARGWFYQIVSKGEWFLGKQISDLGVEAYVGPDPGQDLDTGYADTEAEALLQAYLAAIEANRP